MPKKNQTKDKLSPLIEGWRLSDKKAPPYIKKGYKSWTDQRQRCNNPNDKRYKWWGAKGIKVEYSSHEFVTWYTEQWHKKGPFNRPNCSRIDHNKNYSLDNIMLLECSENAKERMDRVGPPTKGTPLIGVQLHTGIPYRFKSTYEASKATKVAKSNILSFLKKPPTRTIRTGWVFFYPPS